ncbi:MAG: LemA family protein [Crocinitomicaceae bacterium]|nr:LemA family protein [Crocinitomicaceae bacterium]
MDYNEEKFREHIKAVVEASQANTEDSLEERPLTLAELKELAISMGMTEESWNSLQAQAYEHLKASDDHLKARNFTEAIAEAEKATAINPYIKNSNAILARSYMMLWLQTHDNAHRDKAEFHARQELKVDPRDQIAVNVLSTIDKKRRVLESDSNSKKRIFLVVGIVALVVIVLFLILSNRSAKAEEEQNAQIEEQIHNDEYNRIKDQLIVAEENVYSKWDLVQVAIDQRNSMIPDLFAAISISTKDTEALQESINELQSEIKSAEGERKFTLENDLNAKIQELKKIASENGEADNIKTLMVQIEGSENRIAYEKKNYNEAVKSYNILVKQNKDQFPAYETKPYFSGN